MSVWVILMHAYMAGTGVTGQFQDLGIALDANRGAFYVYDDLATCEEALPAVKQRDAANDRAHSNGELQLTTTGQRCAKVKMDLHYQLEGPP